MSNRINTKILSDKLKPEDPSVKSILTLASIVENSTDAIMSMDTTGKISTWNRGAEIIFRRPAKEMIGASINSIVPEEQAHTIIFILDTIKKGEYLKYFETEMLSNDKKLRRVCLSASPITEADGRIRSASLIISDITRKQKTERLLKKLVLKLEEKVKERTQQLAESNTQLQQEIIEQELSKLKLEKINTELKDFAHIVSHDLQAPLRGISHLSEWIIEDVENKLSAESEANLELLKSSVSTMSQMITGILDYSKAGKSDAPKEEINIQQLVNEIFKSITVPETIKTEIDPNLPVIFFQKIQLLQIFQNLISNAIKYMDKPEGLIIIGCEDITKCWRFFIKDNGPGIEPQYHEQIFKMFGTAPSSAGRKDSSGIGLAVVNKIVRENGGEVRVESEPGNGTVFYFTIPKEPHDPQDTSPPCR